VLSLGLDPEEDLEALLLLLGHRQPPQLAIADVRQDVTPGKQCCGSTLCELLDSDPDPHSNCGSGSRRAKMTQKNRNKYRIFML